MTGRRTGLRPSSFIVRFHRPYDEEETMGEVHIRAQPTPNPNALLFHIDRTVIEERMRQYGSPADASGHPLAAALFAIDGVATVFFMPNSITVTKEPERDWNEIAPGAEAAIRHHFEAE